METGTFETQISRMITKFRPNAAKAAIHEPSGDPIYNDKKTFTTPFFYVFLPCLELVKMRKGTSVGKDEQERRNVLAKEHRDLIHILNPRWIDLFCCG